MVSLTRCGNSRTEDLEEFGDEHLWTGQKGHLCSEWAKSFNDCQVVCPQCGKDLRCPTVSKMEGDPWRLPRAKKGSVKCLLFLFAILLLLFLLVQNILGPCWRVGKWLCGLCGWYRVVKFILFSSALFISYLETRDNARVRGEVSCPHATLTRNFTIQLHKKQALNAQKCNMILAGALSMYRADIWWRYSFSNTLSNPTPAVKPFNLQQGLNPPNCK